ncbi:LysR family transcriptional regulator [Salinicola halimionae]|uniref:LysR family transcriptional regulator n=1 Tax=Salinicola halimionae TaxID=1949081 RepID=UPI000DA115AF|nr:LysR family transcriptional regulator [Salinicola halimionae]
MESELSKTESARARNGPRAGFRVGAMELKLLRVFKTVVESGGFSSAQHPLGISLASISKQISDLEVRLGMRLCTRGRDGFELSEEGEIVYRNTLSLFRTLEDFSDRITASDEIVGELSLAVIDNTISDPESPVINALNQLNICAPRVRVSLSISSLEEVERGLQSGRFHGAIMPNYETDISANRPDQFEKIALYEEHSGLYCGLNHPVFGSADQQTINTLKPYKFVTHSYVNSEQRRQLISQFDNLSSATQVEAVAMLILSGVYVGVLPHHYAKQYVEQRRMAPLLTANPPFSTSMELVWNARVGFSQALNCFIDIIQRH